MLMSNDNTYKGIYAMHKYWGKKPFNVISHFIEKYTNEGDTVLDSFCGSGVTLIEALKANRKCIGIDLNPIALKLSKVSMTTVSIDTVAETFNKIKKRLQKQIYSLYEVEENGQKTLVTHTIWKNDSPIEVWYSSATKKKNIRSGREIDVEMATHPGISPKWFPTAPMIENSRINVSKGQTVADLFTPRALVGLSLILDEIKKIQDESVRNVFELVFTGALSQASKLVFVIRRRNKNQDKGSKAEVGSWVIGYWVPEEHFEINVWNCFENRYKRILKGEKEIAELFSTKPTGYYEDNVTLHNGSATHLPLGDDVIDYVFTDPPHVNRILYLEQSLMWNAWLQLDKQIDWNNEIIVSEAQFRKNKDINNYSALLNNALSEIRRVLKKNKFVSMAFNCLDDKVWIDTLNLFINHGFEITDIVPLEYSATSVVQDNRKNALKTDFVLTFRNAYNHALHKIEFNTDDEELQLRITDLLKLHPDYEVYDIMNALFMSTIPEGYIFKASSIVKVCAELIS